jgi:hypothetical protein
VHRHGSALQADYDEAMADARGLLALTRAAGDLGDSGSELARSSAAILQTDLVRTALELRKETDPAKRMELLAKATKAQADIGRMTIAAEKWQAEMAAKVDAKMASLEAEAKSGTGRSFDAETLRIVREEIYGIVK